MTVNAPAWDIAYSPSAVLGGPYGSHWVSIADRAMRQAGASTGKQYEQDQMQTGEFSPVLSNEDAVFSPINTSSYLSPNVGCYHPMRWRAQYPVTTNILTNDLATCGSALAAGQNVRPIVRNWIGYFGIWTIVAESDAFTGPNTFQQTISVAQPPNFVAADVDGWTVRRGIAHSAQAWMRATAGGTTPQVRLLLVWRDMNGNNLSTVTGPTVTLTANSRTWQQLTVSGTAPANACGGTVQIQMVNSVTVTWETGAFQVEYAASPSTWVIPGKWYDLFYGGTERWPQVYDMAGTYGKSKPTVVDPFGVLAQVYPLPPFYSDVLALSPSFFYPLDDPTGVSNCRELTGNFRPAPIVNSPQGAGSLAMGSSVSGANLFLGAPGPVAAFNNNTGGGTPYLAETWIELDLAGIQGVPTTGNWTRMVAFKLSAVPASTSTIWTCNQASYAGIGTNVPAAMDIFVDGPGPSAGQIGIALYPGTNTSIPSPWTSGFSVCDGAWHLIFVVCSGGGSTVTVYLDNVAYTTSGPVPPVLTCTVDTIGAVFLPGNNQTSQGMQGDVAHAAQWNTPLSAGQIANLWQSWRVGWQGESSGSRYARILNWAGYSGSTSIESGATTSMGPASDVDGQTSALTLLENVVTTENGIHFARGDGTVCFQARSHRYNQLIPTVTFGEQTQNGEIPYEDVAFDFDPTHVVGQAQITQFNTGQVFVANSPTTLAPGYRPTFQRTINVTNPQEAQDAATYIAGRYQAAQNRVKTVRLHPAAYPTAWPTVLGLVLSQRVRLNRRSRNNPLIQFDGFVESIKPQIDFDTWDFIADLEISPADLQQYWVAPALHTTAAAAMNSGTNSVTLNALSDASVNPFSCSVCANLQLTLDPANPALAETLTVSSVAGGVPLAPNAAFLNGLTSWTGRGSPTLSSVTTNPLPPTNVPTCAAQVVSTQATTASGIQVTAAGPGFVAGTTYQFTCWVYSTVAANFTTNIDWYTSTPTFLSTTTQTVAVPANTWTQLTTTHTAPATATQGAPYVMGGIMPVNASFQVTAIFVGTLPVVTFTANAAHTHAVNAVVCEAIPSPATDPTIWDASGLVGVTTIPSY